MSVHQLLKLTQSLYSRPHLINQTSFNFISSYLNNRNLMKPSEMPVKNDEEDSPYHLENLLQMIWTTLIQSLGLE